MDERSRRIGRNEALYRAVNEQIEDLNRTFGTFTQTMTVVCECGDAGCIEQIELDVPTYERVRADATLFIVRPGHEIPDVESVVERNGGFDVVRKHDGGPAQIAEETDPRS